MGQETRLYAKLTLDFADSHKIAPLSDAAFRAYVRMLLWSRRMLTDGRIPGPMARVFAKPKVLAELCNNDPVSPSLRQDGDDYWIHDFLEHQSSKEQVEAIQAASRLNGAKGGRPPKTQKKPGHNPGGYLDGTQGEPVENTESETQTQTPDGYDDQSSEVLNREGALTDQDSIAGLCAQQALAVYGVEFGPVRTAVAKATDTVPNPSGVLRIIVEIMGRSKGRIDKPTGYVINSIRNDWAEWQQFLHEEGLVA